MFEVYVTFFLFPAHLISLLSFLYAPGTEHDLWLQWVSERWRLLSHSSVYCWGLLGECLTGLMCLYYRFVFLKTKNWHDISGNRVRFLYKNTKESVYGQKQKDTVGQSQDSRCFRLSYKLELLYIAKSLHQPIQTAEFMYNRFTQAHKVNHQGMQSGCFQELSEVQFSTVIGWGLDDWACIET